MVRGALAAAVTPLRDDGAALDEDAFGPYLDFLAAGGLDGILALGTTGEGILLSAAERRRAAELFLEGPLPVIVHAGAQTTAETVALAEHAAASGAAGVAVIGPPYYALDDDALLAHFAAAARAAEPLPFYVYEFKARSGYAVPVRVLERLREELLPVRGAAGTVSGLASVFPERVVALDGVGELRAKLDRYPFQAAAKFVLGRRGVPVREDVRRPLRQLTDSERAELHEWLESS